MHYSLESEKKTFTNRLFVFELHFSPIQSLTHSPINASNDSNAAHMLSMFGMCLGYAFGITARITDCTDSRLTSSVGNAENNQIIINIY